MYMLQQNGEVTRTKMMNIFLTEDMSYGNERTKKKQHKIPKNRTMIVLMLQAGLAAPINREKNHHRSILPSHITS